MDIRRKFILADAIFGKGGKVISAEFPFESKFIEVLGSKMFYIDEFTNHVNQN